MIQCRPPAYEGGPVQHQPGCAEQYPAYAHRESWGPQRCQSCGQLQALREGQLTFRRKADGRRVGTCCNPWHGGEDRTGQRFRPRRRSTR